MRVSYSNALARAAMCRALANAAAKATADRACNASLKDDLYLGALVFIGGFVFLMAVLS